MEAGRFLKFALGAGALSVALLFLVWSFSREEPSRKGRAGRRSPGPPRVTLPARFLGELKKGGAGRSFRWILVYHGGRRNEGNWKKALATYDLVLSAQEKKGRKDWIAWGSRWTRSGPARTDGVFRLAWLGEATPRLRASLVRVLEALVSFFSLPVQAVRLPWELPWSSRKRPSTGGGSGLDGDRLRSWIRGAGPGQEEKGR